MDPNLPFVINQLINKINEEEVGYTIEKPEVRDPEILALIDRVDRDGYAIIPNAFPPSLVAAAKAELKRLAEESAGPAAFGGRNVFEGPSTHRIYALCAKTLVFNDFALHPTVRALNNHFLDLPVQLSSFQSIAIQPGETPQTLHHDDGYISLPRPHKPFGTAIVVALDSFTADNGATVVVPGSHKWGPERVPKPEEAIPAVMDEGSAVFFLGTLYHGGGENRSGTERRALTAQYCQPWIRPIENLMFAVEPRMLGEMDKRMVDMLGYRVAKPFIGHVDGRSPWWLGQKREKERVEMMKRVGAAKL